MRGTPTTVGVYSNIVITATNVTGSAALPAFSITVSQAESTTVPAGTNVRVTPSAGASLTFSNVSNGRTVSIIPSTVPTASANFRVITGSSYNITSTATFSGNITVCLSYSDAALADKNNESGIKLFHYNNPNWANITTSVDTVNNIVCGTTTSLSPFALMEPISSGGGSGGGGTGGGTQVPVMEGWWLVPGVLAGLGMFARRRKE